MSTENVAWLVEINDHAPCVVFAPTKPKARWLAVKNYREAGYGRGRGDWPSVVAWRAPQYDKSPLASQPPKAWCEDYVQCSAA